MQAFREATEGEREEFRKAACAMKYNRYTRTVYWGVIRGKILSERPICAYCGARNGLQVHHITYMHRGEEYAYLEDLDMLCAICHKAQHGLATVEEVVQTERRRLGAYRYQGEPRSNPLRNILPFLANTLEAMRKAGKR